MAWQLVERSNGAKVVDYFETREEAEAYRMKLIAEDQRYEDVLTILHEAGTLEPPPAPPDDEGLGKDA